jgi:hypothetical protein
MKKSTQAAAPAAKTIKKISAKTFITFPLNNSSKSAKKIQPTARASISSKMTTAWTSGWAELKGFKGFLTNLGIYKPVPVWNDYE